MARSRPFTRALSAASLSLSLACASTQVPAGDRPLQQATAEASAPSPW